MDLHFFNNATETVLLIFLIITFLQSGIDKVVDWKGNLSWLTGHFSKSPFKNSVPALLAIITIVELAAGILCVMGIVHLLLHDNNVFAFYGALTSCLALLLLFFGQRINKDYEGAKTIVIYLIPSALLLFLVQ